MRIHISNPTGLTVDGALRTAKEQGKVTPDVHTVVFTHHGSRTHRTAVEVQLGTYDKTTGPTKSRHYKNSGTHGADSIWAATYDEWGWFLSALFAVDPTAKAGPYNGERDFHEKTNGAYRRTCVGTWQGEPCEAPVGDRRFGDPSLCATHQDAVKYAQASAAGRYQGD